MIYAHSNIKDRFKIEITQENERVKRTFELDKHAKIVVGFFATSDKEDLLYFRGTQKIQINDCEVFPEDFETKLMMTGLNVNPNCRMIEIGELESGNGRIEIWFKDVPHPNTKFTPYTVSFYFFSKQYE